MVNIRELSAQGLGMGDQFTITRSFTSDEISAFAKISRDYNPVHCDKDYAKLKGMKAPIAHGLLTASLITEIGGQMGWLAISMTLRFKQPVYADEILTCHWVITKVDDKNRGKVDVSITNEDGVTVLEADVTGILPNKNERNRLKEMLAEGDPSNGVTNINP